MSTQKVLKNYQITMDNAIKIALSPKKCLFLYIEIIIIMITFTGKAR